ncbi:uncharacterized protein LOC122008978 [Zingiber officinale]|uniref:DUF1639 family protein n=1 Tax=Zingiber officinale TaxID=94328 RepID=A0A8J5FVM9_ZINOF|nr:uncharacterized protein LOC122008978 [Zingiber officinale]KAG6486521.1 hypothetical protein ZIOFF_055097 [Zingiber officinale]
MFSAETERRPRAAEPALLPEPLGQAAQGNTFRNFSLPITKTWGNKRVLRCVSVGEGAAGGVDGAGGRRSSRDLEAGSSDRSVVEEVREKLLAHLREAADRINLIVHRAPLPPPSKGDDHVRETVPAEDPETEPSSSAAAWPWKLRTRRRGARVQAAFERQESASPPVAGEKRSGRLLTSEIMERSERPNFSVTLSREEIDEDIYAVTGHRARRRPRKRPRLIQKQLDMLFPGSWLSEVTVDSYKVPE